MSFLASAADHIACDIEALCMQILMSVDGIYENVIKIKPPLVFSIDDANLMLKCLRKSLELLESQADAVADLQRAKLESILPGQQLARKYLDCPSPEP
jgi:hypothetical protein